MIFAELKYDRPGSCRGGAAKVYFGDQAETTMTRRLFLVVAAALSVAGCARESAPPAPAGPAAQAAQAAPSGERLVYVIGCVNCHHQTPKEIMNAPPLLIAKSYSLPEFKRLLSTGVTRDGRDMYAQGSIMGIVAREQLSHLTEQEVTAIHSYLQGAWNAERAAAEEAKIATFPPPTFKKG